MPLGRFSMWMTVLAFSCGSSRPASSGTGESTGPAPVPAAPDVAGIAEETAAGSETGGSIADAAAPAPVEVALTSVICSWGGTGPAPAADTPDVVDAWYVLLVDAAAAGTVDGIALDLFELRNAAGTVVARGKPPAEIRVTPPDRSALDLSAYDTEPFHGTLTASSNLRLWIHGALDTRLAAIGSPTGFRAELTAADGTRYVVEGSVSSPWPTAGPAPTSVAELAAS